MNDLATNADNSAGAGAVLLPRVLLVDDDEMTRVLARDALESAGFSVVEAGDGIEALS